ncbi:hypothetical protein KY290_010605 [Solanum tuberosum]|uniref:Uncharacterized protein n=1 Tax=Solanum tuberosum TaxID=4113 RepID=A0ABQ7VY93_SOLTU|nr:hypothetical protein KY290_010605 [Solanum tuberosum]
MQHNVFLWATVTHKGESVSFLYKFDDDVVATNPPEQPMNYDHDDLQSSCSLVSDATYTSSSSEEESSHPVTPPCQSS